MSFFIRTVSLCTLVACACCSPTESKTEKDVSGGQSGTDSSGDSAGQCDTEGEPAAVDVDEEIANVGTSAEALASALSGPFVLPCVGGDEFECGSAGELEVNLELTGGATVENGFVVYTDEGETTKSDEACSVLRVDVEADISTTDGPLNVTATELVANRRNAAVIWMDLEGNLFGETETLEVYVSFLMTGDSVHAIDAVIDNDSGGHALFSWQENDSGSGGAGSDQPGTGVENGGTGSSGGSN